MCARVYTGDSETREINWIRNNQDTSKILQSSRNSPLTFLQRTFAKSFSIEKIDAVIIIPRIHKRPSLEYPVYSRASIRGDSPLIDHNSNIVGIISSSTLVSPTARGKFRQFFFSKDKPSKIKRSEGEAWSRPKCTRYTKVVTAEYPGIIARIRTVGIYKRAGRFDRFFLFPPFIPISFASLPPLFTPLFCVPLAFTLLLRYSTTWMPFFPLFSLLYFYFRPISAFTLFTFPPLFLRPASFFSSLLTAQRGIRTLDFSTTKLENKRRNVSH